jgi:hypothetical protein
VPVQCPFSIPAFKQLLLVGHNDAFGLQEEVEKQARAELEVKVIHVYACKYKCVFLCLCLCLCVCASKCVLPHGKGKHRRVFKFRVCTMVHRIQSLTSLPPVLLPLVPIALRLAGCRGCGNACSNITAASRPRRSKPRARDSTQDGRTFITGTCVGMFLFDACIQTPIVQCN